MKRLAVVVMLTWLSTGCYVPLNQASPDQRVYYPATRKDFTPGATTRAEVLLKMGEPDEISVDESLLTYRWSEEKGVIFLTGCGPPPSIMATTSFSFAFDTGGVLKSLKMSFDE